MPAYDPNTGNPGEATALDSPSVALADQYRRNQQMQAAALAKQQTQEALEQARQTKLDTQNQRTISGQTLASDATQWAATPDYAGKSFAQAPAEARQHFMSAYPEIADQAPAAWDTAQRNVTGNPSVGLENLQPGQTATVHMNGVPVAVNKPEPYKIVSNPATGEQLLFDPTTQTTRPLVAQNPQGGQSPATGDDALAQMNPQDAAFVKGLSEGRIGLNAIPSRGGQRERIFALAQQYDPTIDATSLPTRQATRKDFTTGNAANALRSGNTAIGHLKELSDSVGALNNSGSKWWNVPANAIASGLSGGSASAQGKFQTAATAVADELAKFYGGKGSATESAIKAWKDRLSVNASPAETKANIDEAINLLASQMQSYKGQYEQGMGKPKDINFLQPQSRAILRQLGHDPDQIEGGTHPAQQPSAAPAQPVSTPAAKPPASQFKSADDVKAAFQAGSLPREQAIAILKNQFGHAD